MATGRSNAVTVCRIKTRSYDVITEQIPEGQIGLQSNSHYKPLRCVHNVSTLSNDTWRNPEHVHQNQRFILATPQLTGHRSHQFPTDEAHIFSESDGLRSSSQLFGSIYSQQITVANAS